MYKFRIFLNFVKGFPLLLYLISISAMCASHVQDEIIITYNSQASEKSKRMFEELHSLRLISKFPLTNSVHYKILSGEKPAVLKYRIKKNKLVKYISLNKILEQDSLNLDSEFSKQWYLENTGQSILYKEGVTGVDIGWKEAMQLYDKKLKSYVAVLDSGFAEDHDEIKDKNAYNDSEFFGEYGKDDDGNGKVDDIWGWDFFDNDSFPYDFDGHGTSISGIISGANDGVGIQGIAPDTFIYPLRVAGPLPNGKTGPTIASVVGALNYVFEKPEIRVVNLSLGFLGSNLLLSDTVAKFDDNDQVLLICAAGNDKVNNDMISRPPSTLDSRCIISVSSIDSDGSLSWFSNYGQNSVDIAAPGNDIYLADITRSTKKHFPIYPPEWTQSFSWNTEGIRWLEGSLNQESYYFKSPTFLSPFEVDIYASELVNFFAPIDLSSTIQPVLRVRANYILFDSVAYLYVSSDRLGPYVKKYSFSGITVVQKEHDVFLEEFAGANELFIKLIFLKYEPTDWFALGTTSLIDIDVDNYSGSPYYSYNRGTSFSAPIVSAVAAMLFSHRPDLLASDVKKIILDSSQPLNSLTGKTLSGGMVRADKAIELANKYRKRVKVSLDAKSSISSDLTINHYGEVLTDHFSKFKESYKIGELNGAGWFFEGDKVEVRATVSDGWVFENWNSDTRDSSNVKEITLTSDINLIAHFGPDLSDSDNDSLVEFLETLIGTDPQNEDTDGDSINDGDEITANSLNPTVDDSGKIESLNFIFGKDSYNAGQSSILNNLSTYNLVTREKYEELLQTMENNATPYTPSWFYMPERGWMWTKPKIFPWLYDKKSSNWMYFKSGHDNPRFYHYGTKEWMTLD